MISQEQTQFHLCGGVPCGSHSPGQVTFWEFPWFLSQLAFRGRIISYLQIIDMEMLQLASASATDIIGYGAENPYDGIWASPGVSMGVS